MTLVLHLVCVAVLLHPKCLTGQDVHRCPKGQWQCDDGNCIPHDWLCDKDGDCPDGSDELDCDGTLAKCGRGQMACVDSPGCVNRSELCDGHHHCFSGSDEVNCTLTVSCLDSDWTCLNGLCISKELRCDGKNDCLDKGGSDENDCGRCVEGGLRCPEGTCVSAQERCDGKAHCSDASDEPTTCGGMCSVNNGGCSHVCVDEPMWGAMCACPPGYKLAVNGAVCTDVDECAQPFPVCSHYCTNTVGSFYCDCKPGFKLNGTMCLATGDPVMLLTERKGAIVLLNSKSQRLMPLTVMVGANPVCLTYDLVRGWYYWADQKGAILKSNGRGIVKVFTGEPGIKSLACDWLNGHLYWTNEKTHTIYMGSPNGSDFTTVRSKDVRPRELVLLPVESSMFWINAGPGNATTLQRSWMDGSEASTLAVLTAQDPHSLTIDVASRRLYWLSVLKMSLETVKVDGTGRYSFTGKLSSKHPVALAVFGDWFYWIDPLGVWASPQNQPDHKIYLQNVVRSRVLTVYHELQQPKAPNACEQSPCQLCLLTKANHAGFICACPNDQVLLPDRPCDYPRFLYGTLKAIHQLEFKGSKVVQTLVFSPKDVIVSFDVDFSRDWIYWVNQTGEIKRTPLAHTQDKAEVVPTITPVCRLGVDQKSGALYWMSCDQKSIGVTAPVQGRPKVLYRTSGEVRDMYVDWLRARLLWLEADRVLSMSLSGGSTTEVLKLGGDVHVRMAFDLRANSLLWHTGSVGLSTMSLLTGRTHLTGGGLNILGSVVAAAEPFLLSLSDDVNDLTLWDRRDRRRVGSDVTVDEVLEVKIALKDIKPGKKTVIPDVPVQDVHPPMAPACPSPSVLCPGSAEHLCISSAQLCNGHKDCPDGFDEQNCVKRCPSRDDFRCNDRRSCVSRRLVCDGRSHCHDGSDERDCPSISAAPSRPAAPSQSDVLKCRVGSRPCRDGRQCVLYSHECDGETDCLDGSDEQDCDSSVTGASLNDRSASQSHLPDTVATQPLTTAKPSCVYPSFLCPGSSSCISSTQLCDKKKDCPDGADEKNCVSRCPNRYDFRCNDRRSCVSRRLVCDGRSHCHDGSDERDCPSISATPSRPAAPSQSDVLKCRVGSRPCRDGRQCVLYSHECDGETDCQDGSDEQDCDSSVTGSPLNDRSSSQSHLPDTVATQPLTTAKPSCVYPSFLCPGSSSCISSTQLCDKKKDCPDGADEKNCVSRCPNRADFRCNDRRSCVSRRLVCDGRSHCHDGSDERDCPSISATLSRPAAPSQSDVLKCRVGSRPCRDGRQCVLYSHECDGETDCQDGSDEQDCDSPVTAAKGSPALDDRSSSSQSRLPDEVATKPLTTTTTKPSCIYPSFLCPGSSLCISSTQLCDKKKDCPDGADEKNCVSKCPNRSDFRCKDRRSCVSRRLVCDGRSHCQDGSDELDCPSNHISAAPSQADVLRCRKGSRLCGNGRECVLYSHECDGETDCQDGSDEQDCDSPVTAAKGSPALDDRSSSSQSRLPDEVATKPLATTTTKPSCIYPSFLCPGSSLCISSTQLCDKKKDCPDGADEKNCVSKCPNRSDFRCKDRRSCVSRRLVCDGRSHCQDGSDELDCPSNHISAAPSQADVLRCRKGSRLCGNGRECVLYSHVCDDETDCQDGSDEEDCPDSCKQGEFQCSHGKKCIPLSQVCDGSIQCLDSEDELDCWRPSKACQLRCDNNTRCLPASHLCDGERDCRDGTDEKGCVSDPIKFRDRDHHFEDAGPPSNQPQEAGVLSVQSKVATTPSVQPVSPTFPPCVAPSVRCPLSPVCISQSQLCDGRRDCPNGTDEQSCLMRCRNPNDFLCKDKRKCVPPSQKCDGRSHCSDGSDEKDCSSKAATSYYSAPSANAAPAPLKCRVGFWPCKDGTDCVLYSHVCDGETDCNDGSDEEGCATRCQAAEFQCAHGRKCIPKAQVCDGTAHCQDLSDESGCRVLADGCHHLCDNGTRCMPENFLCDGEKDCADGSDENKCRLHPCGISQFRCSSGQCVSEALRCDGYADCRDHSDEVGCSRPPRCPPDLRCPHSHQCIMKDWFCDGDEDCHDGADEKDCATVPVTCKEFQWKCGTSQQCIPLSWRCDGQMDCDNGIDEDKCRRPSCPPHHFQCSSGECLKSSLVCNGITNCPDSSDEGVGCAQSNCSSSTAPQCGHQCMSTPQGPRCSCAAGFKLNSDGISCIDIDECNEVKPAVCQHFCSNTRGSYVCHCYHGFLLEPDNRSCKSQDEPLLLASVHSQLLLLGVHSGALRLLSLANRPVFSLDYDWSEQRVYWLSSYDSIRWANLNDTSRIGTLFKGVKPDVIALDWVGRNLYWIDGLVAQILAVSLSDSLAKPHNYTVILDEELEQPSSLLLIPNHGLMLWSEIGSAPQIGRAGMDGTRRQVIVNKGLSWPVSLTFDFLDNRVYWADEKLRCIGSTSLDGQGVKILQLTVMASPFAVEVFNNRVFWSDTRRRTIRSADKNTGKNQKRLLKRPSQPFALRLIHPLSQPHASNPCRHSRCSHLCVLSPSNKALPRPGAPNLSPEGPTAVCRCPPGLSLNKDKVNCALSLDATFLLLLSSDTVTQAVTQVYLRSLQEGSNLKTLPSSGRVLGLPGMSVSTGLDAVVDGMAVYVASSGLVTQLRLGNTKSRQGLTPVGRILRLRDDVITAMAVDWVTANLYWSSSMLPLLHVTSSHFGYTIPLLQGSLQGTTSIALHPPAGRLCYSVIRQVDNTTRSQVECAFMNGRSWQLLWDKSSAPTAVVFSSEGTEVFWADIGDGSINSIGLDGSGYRRYETGPNLVSFTQTDNLLLWITREKGTSRIWYSNNTQHRELWFEVETSFVTMKSYSRITQSGSNSCSENNGGCQHLCLAHPGGRTCRCAEDHRPVGDKACAPPLPCTSSASKSCWDGSKCFPYYRFCDGHVDCADMSDEVDCPSKISMTVTNSSSPDLKLSSSSPSGVETDSKPQLVHDSSPCDVQLCSDHGSCVLEGGETRCHCDHGYEGVNCGQLVSTSHAPLILCLMFLVICLAVVVAIYKKRRAARRNPSIEKETLMTDMGPAIPADLYDADMEDPDSPVDVRAQIREAPM